MRRNHPEAAQEDGKPREEAFPRDDTWAQRQRYPETPRDDDEKPGHDVVSHFQSPRGFGGYAKRRTEIRGSRPPRLPQGSHLREGRSVGSTRRMTPESRRSA